MVQNLDWFSHMWSYICLLGPPDQSLVTIVYVAIEYHAIYSYVQTLATITD